MQDLASPPDGSPPLLTTPLLTSPSTGMTSTPVHISPPQHPFTPGPCHQSFPGALFCHRHGPASLQQPATSSAQPCPSPAAGSPVALDTPPYLDTPQLVTAPPCRRLDPLECLNISPGLVRSRSYLEMLHALLTPQGSPMRQSPLSTLNDDALADMLLGSGTFDEGALQQSPIVLVRIACRTAEASQCAL